MNHWKYEHQNVFFYIPMFWYSSPHCSPVLLESLLYSFQEEVFIENIFALIPISYLVVSFQKMLRAIQVTSLARRRTFNSGKSSKLLKKKTVVYSRYIIGKVKSAQKENSCFKRMCYWKGPSCSGVGYCYELDKGSR